MNTNQERLVQYAYLKEEDEIGRVIRAEYTNLVDASVDVLLTEGVVQEGIESKNIIMLESYTTKDGAHIIEGDLLETEGPYGAKEIYVVTYGEFEVEGSRGNYETQYGWGVNLRNEWPISESLYSFLQQNKFKWIGSVYTDPDKCIDPETLPAFAILQVPQGYPHTKPYEPYHYLTGVIPTENGTIFNWGETDFLIFSTESEAEEFYQKNNLEKGEIVEL